MQHGFHARCDYRSSPVELFKQLLYSAVVVYILVVVCCKGHCSYKKSPTNCFNLKFAISVGQLDPSSAE
eukprot:9370-Heterococcus_DN1.PRE.1